MDATHEQAQDLRKLGFHCYPGCRIEAVEHAINEILQKFSDADVLEAIHDSARVMGLFSELDEEAILQ